MHLSVTLCLQPLDHRAGQTSSSPAVSAVQSLAKAGVQHIVYWSEEKPGSQLVAVHFGHVFAATLRNPTTSIPEVCTTIAAELRGQVAGR